MIIPTRQPPEPPREGPNPIPDTYQAWADPGCTAKGCSTQATVTVDARHGRRCADHPPTYDRGWAMALVDLGLAGEACAYLRAWLAHRAKGDAA